MVLSMLMETFGTYWLIFNAVVCIVVYRAIFKTWNYFSKQNVKFDRGIPFLGSQYKTLMGQESFSDSFTRLYKMFPNEKVFGFFDMLGKPNYAIRDPELIKQISIKDFDHFINHSFDVHEDSDPMFGRSMFVMKDQRWKDMRSTLSPAFTGSKMRLMVGLIVEVSQSFCEYLKSVNKVTECDVRELCERFTNDAIASCAFGLNINSMKDKNNEFFKTGQSMAKFDGLALLKFFGYTAIPKIMNFFKVKFFKEEDMDYFRRIILDNISYREKNNIVRNDMINILIETKKGILASDDQDTSIDTDFATAKNNSDKKLGNKITKWSDDDLVAQSMIFFIAGFTNIALTVSFAAHELAVNPDVQEKLYEEIVEAQQKLDGKPLSYEILQKMKYLEMVVTETMRKWTLSPANDRLVNKPYTIDISDQEKIQLKVGDVVWFAVAGIHMDPKYFPNPEKFDPERFSDENKNNIVSGTYMPFGIGPRNCIASRFSIMETKAFLFYLLANFKLEKSAKTQEPLRLKPNAANVEAEKGFWMKLVART